MTGRELAEAAANAINGHWRYSWYWKRDAGGSLTREGWKQAATDCQRRIAEAKANIARLEALLPKLLDQID